MTITLEIVSGKKVGNKFSEKKECSVRTEETECSGHTRAGQGGQLINALAATVSTTTGLAIPREMRQRPCGSAFSERVRRMCFLSLPAHPASKYSGDPFLFWG